MSVFLGDQLTAILDAIKAGKAARATNESIIDLGIGQLPKMLRDYTDRNRTSPFAFTGNKFEFRAIGSSASVSMANTVLSAAVADSLDVLSAEIEKETGKGAELKVAVLSVLRKHIKETEPIRFNGNNYSKEWEQEAARRNLPNIRNSAYALDALVAPKNIEMLVRQRTFTRTELEARYHTKLEQFIKALQIEAETLIHMTDTLVIPAAIGYQERLVKTVRGLKTLQEELGGVVFASEVELLKRITELIEQCGQKTRALKAAMVRAEGMEDLSKCAKFVADHIRPLMEELRKPVDELEVTIDDESWPLPRYSEMLFIL
ncbi:MAG: hypothetical protein BWY77_00011 [bacterium ADurb.Bin431]|nr:MAG: hypothetical protein BWY77_00011 [bacterium ADurb.Bin431]